MTPEQETACLKAMVQAHHELNRIRARDGVPYHYDGRRDSIDEESFSAIVDALDEAVLDVTGKGAHCHPLLYRDTTKESEA